ncbi:MAG: hypothetical protein KAI26_05415 [Nanoarchaeota archaeon]|nr:hypothetical protein [Nanoarchaeota archaeon]
MSDNKIEDDFYFGESKTVASTSIKLKKDIKSPFDDIDFEDYEKTKVKRKILGYVSKRN